MRFTSLTLVTLLSLIVVGGWSIVERPVEPLSVLDETTLDEAAPAEPARLVLSPEEREPSSRTEVSAAGFDVRPSQQQSFVRGRILDLHGAPIAHAKVAAQAAETNSDASGAFSLGPLPTGEVRVVVTHPDYLPFARRYSSSARDVRIRMTRARTVSGTIVDANTLKPVAVSNVTLQVSRAGATGPWRNMVTPTQQGQTGKFRMPIGIHGYARVLARSETHANAVSEPFFLGARSIGPLVIRAQRRASR